MNKAIINLKDLIIILVSLSALIISFFAFREARLSNILNIEPVISIYSEKEFKEEDLEVIIRNDGNVDVKNINIFWVITFIKSEAKEPETIMSHGEYLSNFLEINNSISSLVDLSMGIDFINRAPEKDIPFSIENHNYNSPDGPAVIDKGRGGLFLIFNVEFRRISDSKLFTDTSYFSIVPMSLKTDVTDIEKLLIPDNRIYKRMLEKYFFYPESSIMESLEREAKKKD